MDVMLRFSSVDDAQAYYDKALAVVSPCVSIEYRLKEKNNIWITLKDLTLEEFTAVNNLTGDCK